MVEETKPQAQTKGHCPECGPNRYADIVCEHAVHENDQDLWTDTKYRVLRCGGCKRVYFQEANVFSEDYYHVVDPETGEDEIEYEEKITYWPSPSKRKEPDWVAPWNLDDTLYNVLTETYGALNIDARTLAAMGIRTIFDRASEVLAVDPAVSFAEKVKWLQDEGKIGRDEKSHLDVLTEAGGASAHRAWEPSLEELRILMDIMEAFLYRTFIIAAEVKKLKDGIPRRQKRVPSTPKK